ncbi:hypothetical protein M3553_22325, partial [Bacillus subtilis]|nr:hypothetical protein [Bacillus subtilis]
MPDEEQEFNLSVKKLCASRWRIRRASWTVPPAHVRAELVRMEKSGARAAEAVAPDVEGRDPRGAID